MEKLQMKRNSLDNMDYMFIPLKHEIHNESGKKAKMKLDIDKDNVIMILKGEDIESSVYLKNKLGVLIELVD